ncbi:hypothetical protein Tco_0061925, partial [Tanacetum coccineum]
MTGDLARERVETVKQELETLHDRAEADEKHVEVLHDSLGITRERITESQVHITDVKTRLQESEFSEFREIGF